MFSKKWIVAGMCSALLFATSLSAEKKPEIRITQVPPNDVGGPDKVDMIAGTTSGARGSEYKVVLYTRTDRWYVQPTADNPYTTIDDKGKWQSETHLGRTYAAVLVRSSYNDARPILSDLPSIGGDVVARDLKQGRTP